MNPSPWQPPDRFHELQYHHIPITHPSCRPSQRPIPGEGEMSGFGADLRCGILWAGVVWKYLVEGHRVMTASHTSIPDHTTNTTSAIVGGGQAAHVRGLHLARAGVEAAVLENPAAFPPGFGVDTVPPHHPGAAA